MNHPRPGICTRPHLTQAIYDLKIEGISRAESLRLVNEVIAAMGDALLEESALKLRVFGAFTVREKRARMGRNPKTLKEAVTTPRRVITFRPSIQLSAAVAGEPAPETIAAE